MPTSKPSRHLQPRHAPSFRSSLRHIHRHHIRHLRRQRQPRRVHIRDHHMPRPHMPRHRRRHDPDRPRPGDQHVLAHQIEPQRRVHRIAQRIENRPDLVIDLIRQGHHVERRQPQIFGESPRLVDPDPPRRRVEMELPRPDLPRQLADQMPLARTALPDLQPLHQRPLGDDLPGKLMPGHQPHRHRPRRPVVPVPDMDVGAADPGLLHLDQHILRPDLRHRPSSHHKPDLGLRL